MAAGLRISSDVRVLGGRIIPFLQRDGIVCAQLKYMNEQREAVILPINDNIELLDRLITNCSAPNIEVVSKWKRHDDNFIKAYYIKEVDFCEINYNTSYENDDLDNHCDKDIIIQI